MDDLLNHSPHPHAARAERETAQAAVEFALILPVVALLLFGAIQFGTAFYQFQQVSHAASQGARVAAVSRTAPDRTNRIVDAVQDATPGLNPAITSGNVSISSTWSAGDPVTVRVSYPVNLTVMGHTYYNSSFVSERTTRVEH